LGLDCDLKAAQQKKQKVMQMFYVKQKVAVKEGKT
jgi:hypothetical protein